MLNPNRYQIRWSNGVYKIFDLKFYSAVTQFGTFDTEKEAQAFFANHK
jgi:hypothetical protein